jgi:hypothetical protein
MSECEARTERSRYEIRGTISSGLCSGSSATLDIRIRSRITVTCYNQTPLPFATGLVEFSTRRAYYFRENRRS